MAEQGRRDVVGDPLALNVGAQPAVRDLATMGVRNPGQSGGQDEQYAQDMGLVNAMSSFSSAIGDAMAVKQDDWVTEGKLQFMQGATEDQIAASGNKWTMQGWQALNAADKANRWFADEANNIANGGREIDPTQYNARLMEQRAQFMDSLPDDPAIRKLYVSQFEDLGPRLAAQQTAQHNEWNKEQNVNAFNSYLQSGSATAADAPRVHPGSPIALSPGVVRSTVSGYTDSDVDMMTRVMLAEAGGEGPTGMAAVGHVILNRAIDGGFGGQSLGGVLMKPGAFSPLNSVTGYAGGEGGQDMGKWDPSGAGYQRARSIALDVLSGNMVDPTGGKVHFRSGDVAPSWEQGSLQVIGGHTFSGQGRNLGVGNSSNTGALKFAHPDQTGINPQFANILSTSAVQLGIDFDITSGTRSKSHNEAVGGATDSRHVHKDAVDISLKGKSDEEKANIVRTLRANGVQRFIAYSKDESIHVDMDPKFGAGYFMFDRSKDNMGKAPAWYQEVAKEVPAANGTNVAAGNTSAPQGVSNGMGIPNSNTVSIAQTQTQDFIRSWNMPQEQKANSVAEQLVTEARMGTSTLWDSTGGISFLQELGATPSQINAVNTARAQYTKDQQNTFNMEQSVWENTIADQVYAGEVTLAEAQASIQARYDSKELSGEQVTTARRLVSEVLTAEKNRGQLDSVGPEFQAGLSELYLSIGTGADPTAVAEGVRKLAVQHGLEPQQVAQYVGQVWDRSRTNQEALQRAAVTADAQKTKDGLAMDEVNTALSTGFGLAGLSGSIGKPGDTVTQQDYGVSVLRQQAAQSVKDAIPGYMEANGGDEQSAREQATNVAMKEYHRKLQTQGVIDKEMAAAWTAQGLNPIKPDGTVSESSAAAFESYMLIRDKGDYASKYFTDPQAREFYTLAGQLFDAGDNDIERAMIGANQMLNGTGTRKTLDDVTLNSDTFKSTLNKYVGDNFDKYVGGQAISAADKKSALDHMDDWAGLVQRQAMGIKAERGGILPDSVIVQMATEDVMRDTYTVGGNFIYTPTKSGEPDLPTRMGLVAGNKDTPHKAITEFLQEDMTNLAAAWKANPADPSLSADERLLAAAWNTIPQTQTLPDGSKGHLQPNMIQWDGKPVQVGGSFVPGEASLPFYVTFDKSRNTFLAYLWTDSTRTKTVDAAPIELRAADVGSYYNAKSAPKMNWGDDWANQLNDLTRNPPGARVQSGADLGAAFGQMAKP